MMKTDIRHVVMMIWSAIATGVIVMSFVAIKSAHAGKLGENESLFASMGLGAVMLSLVMRQVMLRRFEREGLPAPGGTIDQTAAGTFMTGNVICFALAEMPGVFGFILGTSGAASAVWMSFVAGSLLAMIYHCPLPSRFPLRTS